MRQYGILILTTLHGKFFFEAINTFKEIMGMESVNYINKTRQGI